MMSRFRAQMGGRMLVAGVACLLALPLQAQPPHASTPQARDGVWLARSSTWPDSSPERGCIKSTLQTSYALVAFVDAQSPDGAIEKALLSNVTTPELRQLRQEEMALWRREHDPAGVAARHLSGCLAIVGLPVAVSPVLGKALHACLKQTEPASLLTIYRRGGHPLPMALKVVSVRYSPGSEALAQKIYAAPPDSDGLRLREDEFDGCLQAALARPGAPRPR